MALAYRDRLISYDVHGDEFGTVFSRQIARQLHRPL
jgi:hypothetical protein